jgi:cation/acetate symporter
VAFATILAVVAGLATGASANVAHDIYTHVLRGGAVDERREVRVAKLASLSVGVVAIVLALAARSMNIAFLVGLAFAVAASANFPALLLALTWPRFNTTGAVVGVLVGVISSIGLVIISPKVWPGPDAEGGLFSWYDLSNPGIISIPLGFLACWLGTVLSSERGADRSFHELYVRSETGIGAERPLETVH